MFSQYAKRKIKKLKLFLKVDSHRRRRRSSTFGIILQVAPADGRRFRGSPEGVARARGRNILSDVGSVSGWITLRAGSDDRLQRAA